MKRDVWSSALALYLAVREEKGCNIARYSISYYSQIGQDKGCITTLHKIYITHGRFTGRSVTLLVFLFYLYFVIDSYINDCIISVLHKISALCDLPASISSLE